MCVFLKDGEGELGGGGFPRYKQIYRILNLKIIFGLSCFNFENYIWQDRILNSKNIFGESFGEDR